MSIKQISASELHAIITAGLTPESILVDVRTAGECEKGMIAGAKHIPVEQVIQNGAQLAPYSKVYLYCLSGGRSDMAGASLVASGFKGEVYSLTSGLLAWRKEGYAL